MSNYHSNLRLGLLNVRGLKRHIDELKLLPDATNYHLFAVTETKLMAQFAFLGIILSGIRWRLEEVAAVVRVAELVQSSRIHV